MATKKASTCYNTTSSNCVIHQGDRKDEFENQTEVNDYLLKEVEEIKAELDLSTLRTDNTDLNALSTLPEVLQYLIDKERNHTDPTTDVQADAIQISANLHCLAGNCNTGALSLNQFAQMLISEVCSLRNKIVQLESKLIS